MLVLFLFNGQEDKEKFMTENKKDQALAAASKYLDPFPEEWKKQGFDKLEQSKLHSHEDVIKMLIAQHKYPTMVGWLLSREETKFYFSNDIARSSEVETELDLSEEELFTEKEEPLDLNEEENLLLKRAAIVLFACVFQDAFQGRKDPETFYENFMPNIHNALMSNLGLLVRLVSHDGELGFSVMPAGPVSDGFQLKVPIEELETLLRTPTVH